MTSDVEVHGEVLSKGEGDVEQNCGLRATSHQDLPSGNPEMDVNGTNDADGSYVFVSGDDAVADDDRPHVLTDRNGACNLENDKDVENGVGGLSVENGKIGDDVVGGYDDGNCANSAINVEDGEGESEVCEVLTQREEDTHVLDSERLQLLHNEKKSEEDHIKAEEHIKAVSPESVQETHKSQTLLSKTSQCEYELPQDNGGEENHLKSTAQVQEKEGCESIPVTNVTEHAEEEAKSALLVDVKECEESENSNAIQIGLDQDVDFAEISRIPISSLSGLDREENLEPTSQVGSVESTATDAAISDEIEHRVSKDSIAGTTVDANLFDSSQSSSEQSESSDSASSIVNSTSDARAHEVLEIDIQLVRINVDVGETTTQDEVDEGNGVPEITISRTGTSELDEKTGLASTPADQVSEFMPDEDSFCEPDVADGMQEGVSVNELVDSSQNRDEQNGFCEIVNKMPIISVCENLPPSDFNDLKTETKIESESDVGVEMITELSTINEDDESIGEVQVGNNATSNLEVSKGAIESPSSHPHASSLSTSSAQGESEVGNSPTGTGRDVPSDHAIVSESQGNIDDELSICPVTNVSEGADKTFQEVEDPLHSNESLTTSKTADTSDEQPAAEVERNTFRFLIRNPRYDDDILRDQIQRVKLQVEERTKSRDAIRIEIQKLKVNCKDYNYNFETFASEERTARELLKSKRQEIDSLQSVINRAKNAISVEDIDSRIRNMEHMIQHETLPLKEEKHLIREIKQMRQQREQLSSSMGRADEVQQAMDQKDQFEEQLKILRKEADLLRDKVLKAETVTKAAKRKYYDESEKLNELHIQFKAADDIRQKAYAQLQGLKKDLFEKNKYFRDYRKDIETANELAVNRDKDALHQFCVNQVERFMELWNNNDVFRKEYIRCNTRSTLRRLGTLDGRSLAPDEEPPLIPIVINRVNRDNVAVPVSIPETEKQVVPVPVSTPEAKKQVPMETEKVDAKSTFKVSEQKNQTGKSKRPVKTAPSGRELPTVLDRDEIEEESKDEHKQSLKEEEFSRKAEELRKEEEVAKLKEQRRLEEKAKAMEALERKKRIADKAQARAVLKAQKEAAQKEKEKERRARKKERRNAITLEDDTTGTEGEPAPSPEPVTETARESEGREKPATLAKRTQKPSQFSRAKSIPLPLRNRGKRRMQSWMWVLLIALIVFALFLIGNSSFSFKFGMLSIGF